MPRTDLADLVRPEDPIFYQQDVGTTYRRLREEAPVYFYEPLRLWLLSKYEDVKQASSDLEHYTSTRGAFMNDLRLDGTSADAFFADSDIIAYLEGPRHTRLRRAIAPVFGPRRIAGRDERIQNFCDRVLDHLTVGEPFDFVDEVAIPVPVWAVADLCGMPASDEDIQQIRAWSEQLELLGSPITAAEMAEAAKSVLLVSEYVQQHIDARLATGAEHRGDDLISLLLRHVGDLPMETINSLVTSVYLGGNDTTRALMSSTAWALARHPDQYELLRSDPSLVPAAVEETLRWMSPVNGFVRTVVHDIELRGQTLRAGDRVLLFFPGANRDDEVFDNPDAFDITRSRGPANLAFGYGPHFCPGQGLARLEGTVLLRRLVERYAHIALAGEPEWAWSMLRNGFAHLPVTLSARP
jgi:cytochrome P450